jgi:hypothetical protein
MLFADALCSKPIFIFLVLQANCEKKKGCGNGWGGSHGVSGGAK